MNTVKTPPALRSLLGDIAVNTENLSRLEEIHSRLVRNYSDLVEALRHAKLLELVEIYEKIKNCTEHYSWVLNKTGRKYYYYYLKCKGQKPVSIYIGKSPEGYNAIKRAVRSAVELKLLIDKLREDIKELEYTLRSFKENLETLGLTRSTK